jgi:hypothetical protein
MDLNGAQKLFSYLLPLSITQAAKKPTLPPIPVVANIDRQFFSPGTVRLRLCYASAITTAETTVATNQDLSSVRLRSAPSVTAYHPQFLVTSNYDLCQYIKLN